MEGGDNVCREKSGAARLIKGEGISCGSRLSPTAKKRTKTTKSASGIKNFFIRITPNFVVVYGECRQPIQISQIN